MSIMEYNGAAIVAMVGKDCVAVAADRRFGIQAQTVTTDFQKVFKMEDHLYIGLAGLATDVQTLAQKLRMRVNLYNMEEHREMSPKALLALISNMLYEKRFGPYFAEPVIAGLNKDGKPFVASCDLIGCPNEPEDFVVSGTASEQLYGMCESVWEKDMGPDQLFEAISQALLNGVDRDAVSGWGAIVHVIEKDKVTTRTLKGRMD